MAKIIHYCWFGGNKKPKKLKKYIKSWKKYLPDYEIMEWNESNFDVNITKFSKKAYECKKWAFVSDVARIYALKEYGGIYFDTDVQVIKSLTPLLDTKFLCGMEIGNHYGTGIIGAEKNSPIIKKILAMATSEKSS